eukprot:2579079-Rhodomonas_salina.1
MSPSTLCPAPPLLRPEGVIRYVSTGHRILKAPHATPVRQYRTARTSSVCTGYQTQYRTPCTGTTIIPCARTGHHILQKQHAVYQYRTARTCSSIQYGSTVQRVPGSIIQYGINGQRVPVASYSLAVPDSAYW